MPASREYRLLSRTLETDFAETYRAVATGGDDSPQPAHVHLLTPRAASAEVMERLKKNASAIGEVRFPNLLVPWEVGRIDERWALAMPAPPGHHLDTILARCRTRELSVPLASGVHLAAEAANGLSALHQGGLCHGGIGPEDVVLCFDGSVKIRCDGLRLTFEALRATRHLAQRGRKKYRAPELARGASPGPIRDVFALGVVAFEIITGHSFEGGPRPGSSVRADSGQVPSRLDRRIPAKFDPVLLRAVDPVPTRRYADGAALREALWEYLDGMGQVVTPAEMAELASSVLPNEVVVKDFDPNEQAAGNVPIEGSFSLDTSAASEEAPTKGSKPRPSRNVFDEVAGSSSASSPGSSIAADQTIKIAVPACDEKDDIKTETDPEEDSGPNTDPGEAPPPLSTPPNTARAAANPQETTGFAGNTDNEQEVERSAGHSAAAESHPVRPSQQRQAETIPRTSSFGSTSCEVRQDELEPPAPEQSVYVDDSATYPEASAEPVSREPDWRAGGYASAYSPEPSGGHAQPSTRVSHGDSGVAASPELHEQSSITAGEREEPAQQPAWSAAGTARTARKASFIEPPQWLTMPVLALILIGIAVLFASIGFTVGRLTAPERTAPVFVEPPASKASLEPGPAEVPAAASSGDEPILSISGHATTRAPRLERS